MDLYITCPLKSIFGGFCFYETGSLRVPGCLGTHMADQASPEFTELSSCSCLCAGIKVVLHSPVLLFLCWLASCMSCFQLYKVPNKTRYQRDYVINVIQIYCWDLRLIEAKFLGQVHIVSDFPSIIIAFVDTEMLQVKAVSHSPHAIVN